MMIDDLSLRLQVSPAAQRAARALAHMPLGTVERLAEAQGVSIFTLYPEMRALEEAGLATSTTMGAARGRVGCWSLTQPTPEVSGLHQEGWHLPGERAYLLERFPLVDRFYQVANSIQDLGRLQGFSWFSGLNLDAATTYERGWAALFWSGTLETERGLIRRLTRLGLDMVDYSLTDESAWPAVLYWVVADRWQRELVLRAAKRFRLQNQVAIWCVADDTCSTPPNLQVSRGGIHQPLVPRSLGTWSWDKRVAASLWSPPAGKRMEATIRVVAEWPGCRRSFVQAATHEGDRKRCEWRLKWLVDGGWLRRKNIQGVGRYSITAKILNVIARLDGTSNGESALKRHRPAWERPGISQSHEDRVMDLGARFMDAGLVVAAGWRSWEHMGMHGAIKPDAMVWLSHSPYGPGWHYLEWEQSARRKYKIGRKLNGYASGRRQDDWPVLVVAWDDEPERILQELGRKMGIRMMTTTRKRLVHTAAVGSAAIWSMYGTPAPIG